MTDFLTEWRNKLWKNLARFRYEYIKLWVSENWYRITHPEVTESDDERN